MDKRAVNSRALNWKLVYYGNLENSKQFLAKTLKHPEENSLFSSSGMLHAYSNVVLQKYTAKH